MARIRGAVLLTENLQEAKLALNPAAFADYSHPLQVPTTHIFSQLRPLSEPNAAPR